MLEPLRRKAVGYFAHEACTFFQFNRWLSLKSTNQVKSALTLWLHKSLRRSLKRQSVDYFCFVAFTWAAFESSWYLGNTLNCKSCWNQASWEQRVLVHELRIETKPAFYYSVALNNKQKCSQLIGLCGSFCSHFKLRQINS